ncbi:hypothetical protein D3C78_1902690 [compost metagenome]
MIIESMLPAATPKNRFGSPSFMKSSLDCQFGWAMMPTRKPWASSRRPIMAMPNDGWST